MKRPLLLLAIFLLLLGGCAPWYPTGGPYQAKPQNVSLDLPSGWMRQNRRDILLVTRDGALLQNILVETIHVRDSLKFTKKKFAQGMLPQEQSEIILDNMTSNQDFRNLKVLENKPAKVAGIPGFRLLLSFEDEDGLAYRRIYYGFMEGEWFYGIRFTAPRRHYFDRDRKKFEKSVASLKLLKS